MVIEPRWRMDKAQGKSGVLETMEESKDKIPYDKAVWYSRMEGAWNGKLPQRSMESGTNAKLGSNE